MPTEIETKALEAAVATYADHLPPDLRESAKTAPALGDAIEAAIRAYLAALDSPIGEQGEDPHHTLHIYEGDGGVIIRDGGNISTFGVQSAEVTAAFNAAALSPERKEPVAWARRFEGRWLYTRITRVAEIWREQGCEVQPLYATPEQPT